MALFYEPTILTNSMNSISLQKTTSIQENKEPYRGFIYIPDDLTKNLSEQFKGTIQQEKKIPYDDIGEPLPYDMNLEMLQGIYSRVGIVTGVIDKYIDFVISPGFYVKSEDLRAQKIIEDFIQAQNFDSILRSWIRDGLLCGNGYLELSYDDKDNIDKVKILNPKNMFVKRDIYGNIEHYTQYLGFAANLNNDLKIKNKVFFKPNEIAHFAFNKIGDSAYGIGIVYPALTTMDYLIKANMDMHKILSRKANAQLHVKMGDPATGRMPPPEVITAMGQRLQYMNEKTEWATDCFVDMKILDYGNVSDKFIGVVENDFATLFYTFQIPEVLMGRGNINEGIANVQLDGFNRRIQSIQAELERVIETQIFKRILKVHGIDSHVEVFWGEASDEERRAEIDRLALLLQNPLLNMQLRQNIENKLSLLLGFTEKIETEKQEREREEEKDLQPVIPGQNKSQTKQIFNSSNDNLGEIIYKGKMVW